MSPGLGRAGAPHRKVSSSGRPGWTRRQGCALESRWAPRQKLPSLQAPTHSSLRCLAGSRLRTWAWRVAICFSRFRLASSSSSSCSFKEFFSSSTCFSLVLRLSFCRFSSCRSSYSENREGRGSGPAASGPRGPHTLGGRGERSLGFRGQPAKTWQGAGRTQRARGCRGGCSETKTQKPGR